MKHMFYDIKAKAKVEREVTEKVDMSKNGQKRFAFKSKTEDGRPLTAFVSKETFDAAVI